MKRAVTIAAAMTTALMVMAGPATASASAGAPGASARVRAAGKWRIAHTDPTLMSEFSGVAAFSRRDVWVAGSVTPPGPWSGNRPVVQRWNGRSWRNVALPRRDRTAVITAFSAASARDVWVFGQYRNSKGQAPRTFALRWNGSGWSRLGQWFTYHAIYAATVIGPRDVWIFGDIGTLHYNGTGWTKYSLPYQLWQASAVRSSDVWAVGTDIPTGAPVLARWNGAAWQTKPLPTISSAQPGPALGYVYARSDADIWVTGNTVNSQGAVLPLALHRTGGQWQHLNPPGSTELGQVIPDGRHGVWVAETGGYGEATLLHYSAGTWTSVAMPTAKGKFASVSSFARVPGTSTLFGAGMLGWGGYPETEGLVVKN